MTNAPAQAPIPPQRVMAQFLFGKQLTASLSALARLGVVTWVTRQYPQTSLPGRSAPMPHRSSA
jgi:hypothetical protein